MVNVWNLNPHCQKGRARDLSDMPAAWSKCCRQSHRLKCYTLSTPIFSVRGSSHTHLTREIITEFHLPAKLHGRHLSRLAWKLSCTSTVEWVRWDGGIIQYGSSLAPDLWLFAYGNVLSLSGEIPKLSKNPKHITNLIEFYSKALTDVI